MKPFPVKWMIDNEWFTKIESGYVPKTQYSQRETFVIKADYVKMHDELPQHGEIVMMQVTHDNYRNNREITRYVVRLWKIENPHENRKYPELYYVSGATRTTTHGAYSKTILPETKQIIVSGYTLSGTGMHGSDNYLILLQPGESFTFRREWRSNQGNSGERTETIAYSSNSR